MPGDVLEWTPEQLTDAISNAIKMRDFEAVVALLKLLAVKDPERAQQILDVFEIAKVVTNA